MTKAPLRDDAKRLPWVKKVAKATFLSFALRHCQGGQQP